MIGIVGSVLGVVVGFALTFLLVVVLTRSASSFPGAASDRRRPTSSSAVALGTLITFRP